VITLPNPTLSDVHVDRALTNISIAYIQDTERNFVANKVFPIVPVTNKSDRYFIFSQADFFRNEAQVRAPGAETAGGGYRLSTDNYNCDVLGYHADLDDQTRANADQPLQLERSHTVYVTQQLLLKREVEWVSHFFTTGLWTGSTTGTDLVGTVDFTQWDNIVSTPIEDITNQADSISRKTGYRPNCLVLGPEVYTTLKNHPDILDRVKYTQKGVITEDILAVLFDVERVLVPRAVQNTANENATASYAFVYGKNAFLGYSAPAPGLYQPSAGYLFTWQGLFGAGAEGVRIKNFRVEVNAANRIEGESAWSMKVIGADLGVFFSAAIA
jgi:hypothetical protein